MGNTLRTAIGLTAIVALSASARDVITSELRRDLAEAAQSSSREGGQSSNRGGGQQPPAAAQPPATPDQPQQPPAFRTNINFVRVDVIVPDKPGNAVADLKASDFEVAEDNKPQKIESFKLVK